MLVIPIMGLAATFEPLWECPIGQEPIQFLEQPLSVKQCGVPIAGCLREGAPSSSYHYLCPARQNKLPYQCPEGQVYRIMPADDSPLLTCGPRLQNCVVVDPPRNSLYDCRQSTPPAPTVSPRTSGIPAPIISSPIGDGPDLQPTPTGSIDSALERTFWQRLFDFLFGWLQ